MLRRKPSFSCFPIVLGLLIALGIAGCGVKGPPLPPIASTPQATDRNPGEPDPDASPTPKPSPTPTAKKKKSKR